MPPITYTDSSARLPLKSFQKFGPIDSSRNIRRTARLCHSFSVRRARAKTLSATQTSSEFDYLQAADPAPKDLRRDREIKLTTFNVLAPIYKRLTGEADRESDHEELYMARNGKIIDHLIASGSSILCLQEFWHSSDELRALYTDRLTAAGYELFVTPRTNGRGDGLLTAHLPDQFALLDQRSILFNDCADRVAQLSHFTLPSVEDGSGDFLLVNLHLLFPHNSNSTLIRLRQVWKVIEYLQVHKEDLPSTIPILLCGDWNGTNSGQVFQFMRSQGFESLYDSQCGDAQGAHGWVTHLNHHGKEVGVDFIWLLNPSQQTEPLTANWRLAIFTMMQAKLAEIGKRTSRDAFDFFVTKRTDAISLEDFYEGLKRLGLTGEGSIGVDPGEVDEMLKMINPGNRGWVTYDEFCGYLDVDSMASAYEKIKAANDIWEGEWDLTEVCSATATVQCPLRGPGDTTAGDLVVQEVTLPAPMAKGEFPRDFARGFSDHAPLTAVLAIPPMASQVDSEAVQSNDLA